MTLINRSKSKGDALISLLPHFCSISGKDVAVSKASIHSTALCSLHDLVKGIGRRTVLFGSAFFGGVSFKIRKTALRRIRRTTHVTGTRSFVVTDRSKCSAGVNSHNNGLSNKRHRHVDVTHTVLGGPPVLVLSRTASTLSARSRHLIRRTLRGLVHGHAAVIVTRQLSAVHGTSRVYIVRRKRVIRHKQRRRLVTLSKCCGELYSVRDF